MNPCPLFIFALDLKRGCRDEGFEQLIRGGCTEFICRLACDTDPYPGKVHEYLGDLYMLIGKRQNAASTLDAYKILAVYLRPNERSSHITCLLLKILKAMYFNGLKLVACGSIERRYFKQCSGLDWDQRVSER